MTGVWQGRCCEFGALPQRAVQGRFGAALELRSRQRTLLSGSGLRERSAAVGAGGARARHPLVAGRNRQVGDTGAHLREVGLRMCTEHAPRKCFWGGACQGKSQG